ncbi:MAG: homoserine kinase [Cyanobacteria bacterium]|nr:homoserine kinase [Cyanobacteriota bacterium]
MSALPNRPCRVQVPATSANLGPGFDSFGMALKLYNRFEFKIQASNGPDIIEILPGTCVDVTGLDEDPVKNISLQAFSLFCDKAGLPRPSLQLGIEAHIPLARGLGSSSSAIVAGLIAGLTMLKPEGWTLDDLIPLAIEIEGHPDNVVPALLGGTWLCDVVSDQPFYRALPWPEDWKVLLIVPEKPLLTHQARKVLPASVSLADAVYNLRKASLWSYAVLQQDTEAFRHSLEDRLHQPYRAALIPHFDPIKEIARQHGALGTVISGAGPSILVISEAEKERSVIQALEVPFKEEPFKLMRLSVSTNGAQGEIR